MPWKKTFNYTYIHILVSQNYLKNKVEQICQRKYNDLDFGDVA